MYQVKRLIAFDGEGSLKAFCDVEVAGLCLKGLRVVEGKKGLFVSMPRQQDKLGRWYDSITCTTKEAKDGIAHAVLAAYESEYAEASRG